MAFVQISQAHGRVPVTVFHIQDRVNLGNYKELEETAREAHANGTRDLVIDLTQTPSLTSIGIRSLAVIYKMLATGEANHLKLAGAIEPIREMLQIAGLAEFIEMYDTVEEAVASF